MLLSKTNNSRLLTNMTLFPNFFLLLLCCVFVTKPSLTHFELANLLVLLEKELNSTDQLVDVYYFTSF